MHAECNRIVLVFQAGRPGTSTAGLEAQINKYKIKLAGWMCLPDALPLRNCFL